MDSLIVDVIEKVATLTMTRPAVRNALDINLIRSLHQALDQIDKTDKGPRAVVITGSDKHFCCGLDLHAFDLSSEDARQRVNNDIRQYLDPLILRLSHFRYPVIAAVNGPAIGAGLSLALSSDVIIAAENAFFLPSFVRLGLVPDGGITVQLSRRIGTGRSLASLLFSQKIDAQTAFAWGLAYAVVPYSDIHTFARSLARQLAFGPVSIISQLRTLHGSSSNHSLQEQVSAERHAQQIALRKPDCVEGVSAFFEHREPRFSTDA